VVLILLDLWKKQLEPKQRYFIKLAYKGTHYHGWQVQPNAITVQHVLNQALSTVLRENIQVVGAGRTDTGVHASCFWAHFDLACPIKEPEKMRFRLNRYLPDDIAVYGIYPVHDKAHARFDALARTYEYHITQIKDPFRREFAYFVFWELDADRMNQACQILREYKDFTSFSKAQTQTKTNLCDIYKAHWTEQDHHLIFTIQANRFLRNMVRAIVGTMIEIGQGRLKPEDLHTIIQSKNRSDAGYSVPANGLYLTRIEYPQTLDLQQL
jgi:tRNA pseudouridine38-40 synthase